MPEGDLKLLNTVATFRICVGGMDEQLENFNFFLSSRLNVENWTVTSLIQEASV